MEKDQEYYDNLVLAAEKAREMALNYPIGKEGLIYKVLDKALKGEK